MAIVVDDRDRFVLCQDIAPNEPGVHCPVTPFASRLIVFAAVNDSAFDAKDLPNRVSCVRSARSNDSQPYAADLLTYIRAAKAVRGHLPIRINFHRPLATPSRATTAAHKSASVQVFGRPPFSDKMAEALG